MRGEDIACVGFSGQMHGAVMLDEHDKVVRPALIWCDVRTEEQCIDLTREIGPEKHHSAHLQSGAHEFHSHEISLGARRTNQRIGNACAR